MKTVAIVQARMGSTRLPNKVMKLICGVPMIELLLMRLAKAKTIDQIVIATSIEQRNNGLAEFVENLGYPCMRGSENDVLDRYLLAARQAHADTIVRITGDCPLVDPALVDQGVTLFFKQGVDYLSNVSPATFPDGLDLEVFSIQALEKAASEAKEKYDREHVTPYIRRSEQFRRSNMANDEDLSKARWTVDEASDFEIVSKIFEYFSPSIYFGWKEILNFYRTNRDVFSVNETIIRDEGATMITGQKLWRRAKSIIPGGNMLLSKRAEMFLPDRWPTYFSKAKGCSVWDLDGNKYVDMSIMGIGTNILGYGHPEIDATVHKVVEMGNMSTLNCPEEVQLAERLIELHPWADMVRLARTGGEANSIAVRIGRAASGRDKVAVCGYHGWHDWYLSANLGDGEKLAGHLLPGLDPKGVPKGLCGTVFPFKYNDFEELVGIVNAHDIGVIKMEVMRNMGPENQFLQKIRQLATQRGIVLIFDECTSGFRQTFGGLHLQYNVEPDIAMFGKAMGNGYAITAIVGRREIMEAAQSTFISSTFWTERIGPAAALKTLEVMEKTKSWETITATGNRIRKRWQHLADDVGIKIVHWGLPALTGFSIVSENALAYKTLITQEMLKRGFLAGNSVYASIEHSDDVVDNYFELLVPVFKLIKECEDGRDILSLLDGPICHGGFKRLN